MKVLGLDLSMTSAGWARLEDGQLEMSGTVKTAPPADRFVRINTILSAIKALTQDIDLVAIEGYSYQSATSAVTAGELGGVVRYWLHLRRISYVELAPGTWRKAAFGKGNLKKDEVRLHASKRYGVEIESIDALEAWAVGMAAWLRHTGQEMPAIRRGAAA
jgi:Holliday junction resolvasome RuvABC endonuclease subunit